MQQLHFVIIWYYVAVLYYTSTINYANATDENVVKLKEYGLFYLTIWNWLVQTVFLGACVLGDVCARRGDKTSRSFVRLADFVYWTLLFPGTLLVTTIFWALYTVDRELVYPAEIDLVLPWWVNHAIHTNILAVLVLGLCRLRRPPPRALGLAVLTAFVVCYDCVLLHAYLDGKVWVYPVLEKLGAWPNQLWLLALGNVAMFLLYLQGHNLGEKIWGKSLQKSNGRKKKTS